MTLEFIPEQIIVFHQLICPVITIPAKILKINKEWFLVLNIFFPKFQDDIVITLLISWWEIIIWPIF